MNSIDASASKGGRTSSSNYALVSERPGDVVLPDALEMARTRYAFAHQHAVGQSVVEAACGAGHGLGRLVSPGRQVIGFDITESLLRQAKEHYGDRAGLLRCDANALPFPDAAVDTLILFEAIYYFENIDRFLAEASRVLKANGRLLLCWANPTHYEFVPGAYTFGYPTHNGMRDLLVDRGFATELYGGFPSSISGVGQRLRSALKRRAGRLGVIPGGMRGKAFLKRMFYGGLTRFPSEIDHGHPRHLPTVLSDDDAASDYRVLYAVAVKTT